MIKVSALGDNVRREYCPTRHCNRVHEGHNDFLSAMTLEVDHLDTETGWAGWAHWEFALNGTGSIGYRAHLSFTIVTLPPKPFLARMARHVFTRQVPTFQRGKALSRRDHLVSVS